MSEDNDSEKSEEATQTRREDFRKRGQVAQTKELASSLFLVFAAMGIFAMSKFFFVQFQELFQYSFGGDMVSAVRNGDIIPALKMSGIKMMILVAPVLGIAFLIGIASTVLQIGFLQIEDAMTPKFEKINPIDGFKRLFNLRAVVEALKAILKLIFISTIVYFVLKKEIGIMPYLIQFNTEQLFHYMGDVTFRLLVGIGMAMTVLAAGDYFFQRWDLEKKMMMTKQEVKEENKQREGDPLIKARIRRIQREVANRRMMEKVPTADVIVTNPTHIAIALKYEANLPAPQMIAKGADHMAEKIKELARQHNIPIVENKPLARTMFKTMKLGQVIPRELFVAVAEVLSYVYKLRKKKVRR